MRCDLHVHTKHSGMCTVPVLRRICRESYNGPLAVYSVLKQRGMDLVTITDHDSIDAAEQLRRYPDFFLSEEVTCRTPSGTEFHMGVYDIQEKHHIELQRRRDDLGSLLAYLREQTLFFSINHVFSGLTGRRTELDFELFNRYFPSVETLNGQMTAASNTAAAAFASHGHKVEIGGSDSHTLGPLGLTYTEVSGVSDKREFLDGLRQARGAVAGQSGSFWKLTLAVWSVGLDFFRENSVALPLFPLLAAVPLVIAGNVLYERSFAAHWVRRLETSATSSQPMARPVENGMGEAIP